MKWFYIDETITEGDRRQGPYYIDEIRNFVKDGKIKESTLVWHQGEPQWKAWKDFSESKDTPEAQPKELDEAAKEELLQRTIDAILKDKKQNRPFANFWIRALAFTVDNIILYIIGFALLYIMVLVGFIDSTQMQSVIEFYQNEAQNASEALDKILLIPGMTVFISVWSAFQALYFIVFHATMGATPGKKMFHIKVETAVGTRLSWSHSVFRYLCSILTSFTLMLYGLGYVIAIIDPKHRALHDFVAKTVVVKVMKD
ncbi:MAG: RDD family protein [Fibrobacteraceae bacterium]|nr:RDD family protein [Fibrobacteraceae bacterium]